MTEYERLRERHLRHVRRTASDLVARLSWPAERLAAHRTAELRRLVRVAKAQSPWHRERLRGIEPEDVDESRLADIPVMTKADLMANFDDIVTDRSCRRDVVEAHLDGLAGGGYLLGRYQVIASGGSSGHRGVFVYDWDGWTLFCLGGFRYLLRERASAARLSDRPTTFAVIAAGSASHGSSARARTLSSTEMPMRLFPVTMRLDEMVTALNEYQPVALAASCGQGLHINDDLVVVEPVDTFGSPVGAGVRSARLYLTNLINHALPLIRYELTDEVTLLYQQCPCGSAHRLISDPQGRLDETFQYRGVRVHPPVFRSVLGLQRSVVEYQVRQTARGATVAIRGNGPVDPGAIQAALRRDLLGVGLPAPDVAVTVVERLERQVSGKLKRFIPLREPLAAVAS
jgi:phenylacetate-coenzyme A ligase PaaK-like adenylate-forming protein